MNKIFINKPGNTTMVIVATPNGAYTEPKKYKGISHFLEHMCFKGTKKRCQKEISSAIDNIGGTLNAFTDWEITAYWAHVGNSYVRTALDVITDLVKNPVIPNKEIDKEREVIIQELKMYEDNAQYYVEDVFNQALFTPESGFYTSIIGTKQTLSLINKKTIEAYHNTYKPLLIIVGDIEDYTEIKDKYIEQYNFPSLRDVKVDKWVIRKNITQANILLGNYVYLGNYNYHEQSALMRLLDACYSDMSGRLFDVIREKYNMVYRVHFNYSFYNKAIIWQVSAGLEKSNIGLARELIEKELSRPLTVKEINIALQKAIGVYEMEMDSVKSIAYKTAYLAAKGLDYKEELNNYKKYLVSMTKYINHALEQINFKDNVLAGVVPEK